MELLDRIEHVVSVPTNLLPLSFVMHFPKADGNAQAPLDTNDMKENHMWSDSRISDEATSELLSSIIPLTARLE